jgi:hypothetical protein
MKKGAMRMTKFAKLCLLTLMHMAAMLGTASAYEEQTREEKKQVQSTEAQKNELSALHKDILEKKKQLVAKCIEFGNIPKETGEQIISHWENHYANLQHNCFVFELEEQNKKFKQKNWIEYLKKIMPFAASVLAIDDQFALQQKEYIPVPLTP